MRTILTSLIVFAGLTGPAVAAEAPEGGAWIDCSVSSVAVYRDHVSVHCAASAPAPPLRGGAGGGSTPREFAIESIGPLTDPVLRLAIEAKRGGKPLAILYVRDASANPPGCVTEGCRRIAAIELK